MKALETVGETVNHTVDSIVDRVFQTPTRQYTQRTSAYTPPPHIESGLNPRAAPYFPYHPSPNFYPRAAPQFSGHAYPHPHVDPRAAPQFPGHAYPHPHVDPRAAPQFPGDGYYYQYDYEQHTAMPTTHCAYHQDVPTYMQYDMQPNSNRAPHHLSTASFHDGDGYQYDSDDENKAIAVLLRMNVQNESVDKGPNPTGPEAVHGAAKVAGTTPATTVRAEKPHGATEAAKKTLAPEERAEKPHGAAEAAEKTLLSEEQAEKPSGAAEAEETSMVPAVRAEMPRRVAETEETSMVPAVRAEMPRRVAETEETSMVPAVRAEMPRRVAETEAPERRAEKPNGAKVQTATETALAPEHGALSKAIQSPMTSPFRSPQQRTQLALELAAEMPGGATEGNIEIAQRSLKNSDDCQLTRMKHNEEFIQTEKHFQRRLELDSEYKDFCLEENAMAAEKQKTKEEELTRFNALSAALVLYALGLLLSLANYDDDCGINGLSCGFQLLVCLVMQHYLPFKQSQALICVIAILKKCYSELDGFGKNIGYCMVLFPVTTYLGYFIEVRNLRQTQEFHCESSHQMKAARKKFICHMERMLLAVVLAAAVNIAWFWYKSMPKRSWVYLRKQPRSC